MKPKNQNTSGCTNATGSDCITWSGPTISCVGITHGMSLTDVENIIACKICSIAEELDLSDVDLSCLIEKANVKPEDKDLKLVLQLLLDNQCKLKDLIDAISADTGEDDIASKLNLKCIAVKDAFGNNIPQDMTQVLQSLINRVCTDKDRIDTIEVKVDDLQSQINNLPAPPPAYVEPVITTCISTSKSLSQSVVLLASDVCNYKTAVGTPTQIQSGIAQQCPNLNNDFASTPGWNSAPENLAQSFNNLWIAFCGLANRVKAMEQTCCAPSCDKIKLGFIPEYDFNAKTVSLLFESGAGTLIPAGFVDCGSVVTITDQNGVSRQFASLNITMGEGTTPLNLAGMAFGKLHVNIKTKFCLKDSDGAVLMVCQDCVNQDLDYYDSTCCTITNSGNTPVSILIKTC